MTAVDWQCIGVSLLGDSWNLSGNMLTDEASTTGTLPEKGPVVSVNHSESPPARHSWGIEHHRA